VAAAVGFECLDGSPQFADFALLSLDLRLLCFEQTALLFDLRLLLFESVDENHA